MLPRPQNTVGNEGIIFRFVVWHSVALGSSSGIIVRSTLCLQWPCRTLTFVKNGSIFLRLRKNWANFSLERDQSTREFARKPAVLGRSYLAGNMKFLEV